MHRREFAVTYKRVLKRHLDRRWVTLPDRFVSLIAAAAVAAVVAAAAAAAAAVVAAAFAVVAAAVVVVFPAVFRRRRWVATRIQFRILLFFDWRPVSTT